MCPVGRSIKRNVARFVLLNKCIECFPLAWLCLFIPAFFKYVTYFIRRNSVSINTTLFIKCKLVVRLAESHVAGSIVFNIGSSLYSRLIRSHISVLCCFINEVIKLLILSSVILSINAARSFIDKIIGGSEALTKGLTNSVASKHALISNNLLYCIVGLFLG